MPVSWLPPSSCFPPRWCFAPAECPDGARHRITHTEKVVRLEAAFREAGWDSKQPALVGYPWGEGIQLLSGSHRHAAAARAGILIPVEIVPYEAVWLSWGHLERWLELMRGEHGQSGE